MSDGKDNNKIKITRSELWSRTYKNEYSSRHERAPDPTVEFIDRLVDEAIKSGRYEIIPEKTEQSRENNNPNEVPAWKKGSTPTYIGEFYSTIYKYKVYAFYGRGNPGDIDDHPTKGPVIGEVKFSSDRNNPHGTLFSSVCRKREAEVIESFIESDDPAKKKALQDYIKERYMENEGRHQNRSAFEKLEDIYEHDILNQSKLAEVRNKVAKTLGLEEVKLSKPLKRIEKALSDKLFGKEKEK